MPKYLIKARYTSEGLKGLKAEGGTGRREVVANMLKSVGGRLESMYFVMGEDDVILIAEAPDNAAITAVSLTTSASGAVHTQTIGLLTPEDVDKAVKQKIDYRAPGR
jgi:uncharacterized protein with GYD domain